MGRTPVRLREVTYGISSNKLEIMGSLARDSLSAISKKIGGGWFDVGFFFVSPTAATVLCVCVFSLSFLDGRQFSRLFLTLSFLDGRQFSRLFLTLSSLLL